MSIRILSLLVVFAALTGMAAGRGESSVSHRLQPVDVYVPRDGLTVSLRMIQYWDYHSLELSSTVCCKTS